ncbi:MAG: helix-turn-helix transcriptional regulator [Armatimonadetes bacterium]|nr:helix-turn-helix transcriptional regulator [Armatimonadota bacterium]
MSEPGLLDKWFEEWDQDPDFILEGVLLAATERICELMDKHDVSRAELARRLGKSRAYVTRVLNGQPNMTLKTLTQIAVALGEGIDLFVPSSVREERARAQAAHEVQQRKAAQRAKPSRRRKPPVTHPTRKAAASR